MNNQEMTSLQEAMNILHILRKEMADKSEGELYHAWMCNIKFAVYDSICAERDKTGTCSDVQTLEACEEGAKIFLDRLLGDLDE